MIVVDSSVWVAYLRDTGAPEIDRFEELILSGAKIALTDVIWMEILQGIRREEDVASVLDRIGRRPILRTRSVGDFERAAALYRACRRRGETIRRPQDCLIAAVCIRERVALLHADRDFDRIASLGELRVVAV